MQRLIDMSTSELVAMARNEVSSITDIGIHSELVKELTTRLCANTAAVTQALKERDEVRTELSSAMFTISQITGVLGTSETLTISEQVTALNQQVVNLAVENSSLLPKAASELSNAWMLHKYWVGIQVALMHVHNGRLHDGMTWLQNTVCGPGIEAPQLSESAEIEAWAVEQQKDSIGHVRALEIIKAAAPATDAAIASIQAQGVEPLVNALTVIANSEEIDGDTVVCDFSTLVSVAAGALRDHYAQQLRKGAAV